MRNLTINSVAKSEYGFLLTFLDACKGKFERRVLRVKRALQECLRHVGIARLYLSNLLRIDRHLLIQTDDAVVKRLRRMYTEFQEKESISAANPFRQTFLERARFGLGSGINKNPEDATKTKLRALAYTNWCLQEVDKVIEKRLAESTLRSNIAEESFAPSDAEIFIPAPQEVDQVELKSAVAAREKSLNGTEDSLDLSFLWLNAEISLDFEPQTKPSLSELFLSVQNYALEREMSSLLQESESINFSPVDNLVSDKSNASKLSLEQFPETGLMDEASCIDLLLSELNQPLSELPLLDLPLFDLPVFDVDGNLIRSF